MRIKDIINDRLSKDTDEKIHSLWRVVEEIIKDTVEHNKGIATQMSAYDTHDSSHSEKIIEIMESIIGDKLTNLTFTELLLLYMSAYLHDSAMALPSWEYEAMKAVEGSEKCFDNSLKFYIRNDLKPVQKYSEIRDIVIANKEKLFNYELARNYVFAQSSEEKMIDDISELIHEYEEFRNEYSDELRKREDSVADYLLLSESIRMEYIRKTHHLRASQNVKNLKTKVSSAIGELYAGNYIDNLALICQSHGENLSFINELDTEYIDYKKDTCNVQFIAIMLRLCDVIHFEENRAPVSLFAERHIDNVVSQMHWMAKDQEVGYEFQKKNGNIVVTYNAYCKSPELYYFIQDYIDWVDTEISNYYYLKNRWESVRLQSFNNYELSLEMKVDRSGIMYDTNAFEPDLDMKFVLNQTKILDLLMGVQLYKDPYLCLRELYQNALDATKCMMAYNDGQGISQQLPIEFGMGIEIIEGKEQKYIYCLDHGIGMDKYIIKNYLLNIGNSYYKSKDFMKRNAGWNFSVNPTSQFGIGILSGYMIADKIGVTSIYYCNHSEVSFVLGNSERFYYLPPKRSDTEKIGQHGTVVKLYLKKEYEEKVNAEYINKLPYLLMTSDDDLRSEYVSRDILNGNLQYILAKKIGIPFEGMPILVKTSNDETKNIISAVDVFDHRNYPDILDEDVEKLWAKYHYLDGSDNPYKAVVENREQIKDYVIVVNTQNMILYSHIALPKKQSDITEIKIFDYCYFIGNNEGSIYVDGIYVQKPFQYLELSHFLGEDIEESAIINYIGEKRPFLSVDRNSIIEFPDFSDEYLELRDKFISEIKNVIENHIRIEKIEYNAPQLVMVFDVVVREFPTIANELFKMLQNDSINLDSYVDEGLKQNTIHISDIFSKKNLVFRACDFRVYKEITRQLILSRFMNAKSIDVNDDEISICGGIPIENFPYAKYLHYSDEISLHTMVIKADKWEGEYKEFDMVNSLWPIVSPQLYEKFVNNTTKEITRRSKKIEDYGNSISGIATLDPVMIDPDIGISQKNHDYGFGEKNYVGVIENICNSFSLHEFTNYGESYLNEKKSFVMFVYFSPRELNNLEKRRLIEIEVSKPEYSQGIKEGFSVVFIGGKRPNYIIKAGKRNKEEMLKAIPNSYWEDDITYCDLLGNIVFPSDLSNDNKK